MDEHLRRVDVWEPFPSPVPPLKETMAKGAVKQTCQLQYPWICLSYRCLWLLRVMSESS